MRTKEEMIAILSRRKVSQKLAESTWSDLVASVQSATSAQRQRLLTLLIYGKTKQAGDMLRAVLLSNAEDRARADVADMLVDDALNLQELDSLL